MSARRLIFHPGVEDDLADVVAYYGEIDSSLVADFDSGLWSRSNRWSSTRSPAQSLFDSFRRVLREIGGSVARRSANSPQELQKRPFLANRGQQVKSDVSAGQRHFSTGSNDVHKGDRLFRFNV